MTQGPDRTADTEMDGVPKCRRGVELEWHATELGHFCSQATASSRGDARPARADDGSPRCAW